MNLFRKIIATEAPPGVWIIRLMVGGVFLSEGRHGQMEWMADRAHWRGDPAALWPEAQSVIMLADSYAPEAEIRTVELTAVPTAPPCTSVERKGAEWE